LTGPQLIHSTEIKILGFQSPNNMNVEDNIKHSYFIYPDEDVSCLTRIGPV
jgi:hypothetical protein